MEDSLVVTLRCPYKSEVLEKSILSRPYFRLTGVSWTQVFCFTVSLSVTTFSRTPISSRQPHRSAPLVSGLSVLPVVVQVGTV